MRWAAWVVLGAGVLAGCWTGPSTEQRNYELRGQVVALRPEIREVRLAHDEIPGYMPAMTMSFGVKDPRLLQPLERGDLIRATLVVTSDDAWLAAVEKTGHAAVPEPGPEAAESAAAPPPPDLLDPGQAVPDERFTDHTGRPFSLSDLRGRAVAVTFTYTRCPLPTFCPLMDRRFAETQRLVQARDDLRGRVQLLSVTLDPAFDTPAVLFDHARSLGADPATWRFVTGAHETLDRFATRFGVSVVRETGGGTGSGGPGAGSTSGAGAITHNLRTAVIAPDGRLSQVFAGAEWTAETLVEALVSVQGR
jgi:protein SCO1/2